MNASRVISQGYAGDVAFVTDGTTQVHLAEKDLEVGFRTGKAINPVERGHIAFAPTTSTPSSGASTRRASPTPIMAAAMSGWEQIFFTTPKATSSRSIRSARD